MPTEGRIKFEVSLEAAQRAGLTISARLLALAVRVKKGEFQHNMFAMSAPAARRPFRSQLVPLLLHLDASTPSRSQSLAPLL
ncbi:MAG: YfiR family protein [Burkholderiales bacterium]